jgi:hypothetical protein
MKSEKLKVKSDLEHLGKVKNQVLYHEFKLKSFAYFM